MAHANNAPNIVGDATLVEEKKGTIFIYMLNRVLNTKEEYRSLVYERFDFLQS